MMLAATELIGYEACCEELDNKQLLVRGNADPASALIMRQLSDPRTDRSFSPTPVPDGGLICSRNESTSARVIGIIAAVGVLVVLVIILPIIVGCCMWSAH